MSVHSPLSRWMLALSLIVVALTAQAEEEGAAFTYVRPNTDFSVYKSFVVSPLDLTDMKLVPPAWVEKPNPRKWSISDADIEYIRSLYIESITKGIENSGKFDVVEDADPLSIQVDVKIVRLTPWTEKGDKSETLGSGELKFEAELRNAGNGDLLAMVEGVQQVGKEYQPNSRLTAKHNLREHFENWGKQLSAALARQHQHKH